MSYALEQRVLRYLDSNDPDVDLSNGDIEALYHLMVKWRSTAQEMTPGGSEYMDPAYTKQFLRERREKWTKDTMARVILLRACSAAADVLRSYVPETSHTLITDWGLLPADTRRLLQRYLDTAHGLQSAVELNDMAVKDDNKLVDTPRADR